MSMNEEADLLREAAFGTSDLPPDLHTTYLHSLYPVDAQVKIFLNTLLVAGKRIANLDGRGDKAKRLKT